MRRDFQKKGKKKGGNLQPMCSLHRCVLVEWSFKTFFMLSFEAGVWRKGKRERIWGSLSLCDILLFVATAVAVPARRLLFRFKASTHASYVLPSRSTTPSWSEPLNCCFLFARNFCLFIRWRDVASIVMDGRLLFCWGARGTSTRLG